MKTSGKKILIICIVAVIVVIISAITITLGTDNTDPPSGVIGYMMKPIRIAVSSVGSKFSDWTAQITKYNEIKGENEQLKKQVAELQDKYLQYVDTLEENEKLRNLLKLADDNPNYQYAEADIISWSASSWSSSFTICKGSDDGIELHDCVIDEFGHVVGQITQLSPGTAVVTTILDTTSSFGAKVLENGDTAIASGKFELFTKGTLALEHLSNGSEIASGYTLVTSGFGGIYPQGLIIGSVSDVVHGSSGLYDYAIITPSADFDSLDTVFVITSY